MIYLLVLDDSLTSIHHEDRRTKKMLRTTAEGEGKVMAM